MKAIITVDTMNAYPDHLIPFHVYTSASDFQLGAAIVKAISTLLTTARKSLQHKRTTLQLKKIVSNHHDSYNLL